MAQLAVLVAGLLLIAESNASDLADPSTLQGFLSKYVPSGSDASKSSMSDYDKFIAPNLNRVKHGNELGASPFTVVDDKPVLQSSAQAQEKQAAQELLANKSYDTISLSVFGIGLVSFVTMLGLNLWRALQPAAIPTNTVSALGGQVMEMKSQDSNIKVSSGRVGWGQSWLRAEKAAAGALPARAATSLKASYEPMEGPNAAVDTNNKGEPWVSQMARPRRNRKSAGVRSMVRENFLTPANLMQPIFIHEDSDQIIPIESMPGQSRHTLDSMVEQVKKGMALGVKSFILFPKVPDNLKTNYADECYNPDGIVPRAVAMCKAACPEATICTDIALDPYSDQGHDGVVLDGKIVNDITINQLCKQAVCHARAGADFVGPSDMMDGRVGALRLALDAEGYTDVGIISYSAKYASSFYGPFRDALDSHPGFGDKKTYQQDPANGREAVLEATLDAAEGADMLMVKPGVPYLDVIKRIRDVVDLPIAAYHVSGEYAMIKAAAEKGWVNEKDIVLETLMCFRRAGTDLILTYYATDAAQWMKDGGEVCL